MATSRLAQDPTRDEMLAFLAEQFPEADEFDREEAIYWFAHDWHSGQWSELYKALFASQYHPGALANGPEPGSIGEAFYQELEARFAGGRVMSDSTLTEAELAALENIIDRHGIENVLMAISEICGLKAEHIAVNWQDTSLAKRWATLEGAIGCYCVTKAEGL